MKEEVAKEQARQNAQQMESDNIDREIESIQAEYALVE